jgi:hypothetical protein
LETGREAVPHGRDRLEQHHGADLPAMARAMGEDVHRHFLAGHAPRRTVGEVKSRKPLTRPRKIATQERSRATVDSLVEATARILVKEGFDKASTNRICEARP